jgi:citrate lyase subunit beta / citryl-CoA lyase
MTLPSIGRARGLRRSKLVAKGGTWEAMAAANASQADIVHIELESGFPSEARAVAVTNARRALDEMDWSGKEPWVRFRHVDMAETLDELSRIIAGRPTLVYCAKMKSAEELVRLDQAVSRLEEENGIERGSIQIGAVIERIESLRNVEAIAAASPRMGAIMFGANDMSLDFGYRRSSSPGIAYETLYIRGKMVLAGRLAKIDIIDAAYMGHADLDASEADAQFSARLGFTGKTALTASQVPGINRAFVPVEKELAWAREVVAASRAAVGGPIIVDEDVLDQSDLRRAEILLRRAS